MKKSKQATEADTRDGAAVGRPHFAASAALIGAGMAIGPLLGAINVRLTPEDLRQIETELSKIEVPLGRISEKHMWDVDKTA